MLTTIHQRTTHVLPFVPERSGVYISKWVSIDYSNIGLHTLALTRPKQLSTAKQKIAYQLNTKHASPLRRDGMAGVAYQTLIVEH